MNNMNPEQIIIQIAQSQPLTYISSHDLVQCRYCEEDDSVAKAVLIHAKNCVWINAQAIVRSEDWRCTFGYSHQVKG